MLVPMLFMADSSGVSRIIKMASSIISVAMICGPMMKLGAFRSENAVDKFHIAEKTSGAQQMGKRFAEAGEIPSSWYGSDKAKDGGQ